MSSKIKDIFNKILKSDKEYPIPFFRFKINPRPKNGEYLDISFRVRKQNFRTLYHNWILFYAEHFGEWMREVGGKIAGTDKTQLWHLDEVIAKYLLPLMIEYFKVAPNTHCYYRKIVNGEEKITFQPNKWKAFGEDIIFALDQIANHDLLSDASKIRDEAMKNNEDYDAAYNNYIETTQKRVRRGMKNFCEMMPGFGW